MVVNRLWEVSSQFSDWYNNTSDNNNNNGLSSSKTPTTPSTTMASNSIPIKNTIPQGSTVDTSAAAATPLWDYASTIADSTYTTLSDLVSSSWKYYETSPDDEDDARRRISTRHQVGKVEDSFLKKIAERRKNHTVRPSALNPSSYLLWNNPYSTVRGRQMEPSSMSAIRDLIAIVPTYDVEDTNHQQHQYDGGESKSWEDGHIVSTNDTGKTIASPARYHRKSSPSDYSMDDEDWSDAPQNENDMKEIFRPTEISHQQEPSKTQKRQHNYYSPSETASQLAEGTIRALRDLALDEAVELQEALRFWTERWERPTLSWIEAGPAGKNFCRVLFVHIFQSY